MVVGDATVEDRLQQIGGLRHAVLTEDATELGSVDWEFTFAPSRVHSVEFAGGESVTGLHCPSGQGVEAEIEVTMSSESGVEGSGPGTAWLFDAGVWVTFQLEMSAFEPLAESAMDEGCGDRATMGTPARMPVASFDWSNTPSGGLSTSSGSCSISSVAWSLRER